MKTINLTTKQVKDLAELLFRGRAYTDMFYSRDKRCTNVYKHILRQFESQGGQILSNGGISFKRKKGKASN